jgi:diguanylate cyclase (GGDEF)-like protein
VFRKFDLSGDVPEYVALRLREALFSAPSSIAMFVICLAVAALIMWWRTHDIWLVAIALTGVFLMGGRMTVLFFFRRRKRSGGSLDHAAHLALVNAIGSCFALTVAALLIRAVYLGEIISIELATMAVAAYIVGLVTRASAIPQLAIPHLLWLFAPLIAAAIIAANLAYCIMATILVASYFSYRSLILDTYEKVKGQLSAEHRLSVSARTDHLTGLANRVSFHEQGSIALESARSSHSGCVLALIDLDGFKSVNDTYGHRAGDEFLKEVGTRIRTVLGGRHFPVRLGGDEFAVVFDRDSDLDNAIGLGKQILAALSLTLANCELVHGVRGTLNIGSFSTIS